MLALPEGDVAGSGWGLTLFMRRGTVAWMEAWPSMEGTDGMARHGTDDRSPVQPLPSVVPEELVLVLAEIVAGRYQEVAA